MLTSVLSPQRTPMRPSSQSAWTPQVCAHSISYKAHRSVPRCSTSYNAPHNTSDVQQLPWCTIKYYVMGSASISSAPEVVGLWIAGRFGFVEMRTEELSHHAMNLDKVELCGRHVNVGRPKGYVESATAPPPPAIGAAAAFAAQLSQEPTTVLRLDNMVKARLLLTPQEKADVSVAGSWCPAAACFRRCCVSVSPAPGTDAAWSLHRCSCWRI